jgi:hypothetical protein
MSWIEKELKKRAAETRAAALEQPQPQADAASEQQRMSELWARFRNVNSALPDEIRLKTDEARSSFMSAEEANVVEWLRARNGAALGTAGTAVRYVWPERSPKKSKNFWIRWSNEKQAYILIQRVSASMPPRLAEYKFDEGKVEQMLKCLVQGRRVKPGAVRRRRLWLF